MRRRCIQSLFFILLLFFGVLSCEWVSTMGLSYLRQKNPSIRVSLNQLEGKLNEPYIRGNGLWHHELNPNYDGHFKLTSYGTRGDKFSLEKPPGELRILYIGDSTTEGWKTKEDETFPYYTKMYLHQALHDRSITCINMGIGSHNTAFNTSLLAFKGIHLKPDIVVIKSAYNDFHPFNTPNLKTDYSNVFSNPLITRTKTNKRYWAYAKHSYFLTLLGLMLLDAPIESTFKAQYEHLASHDEFMWQLRTKFHLFTQNVISMIAIARIHHAEVILLDMPSSPDASHKVFSNRVLGQGRLDYFITRANEVVEHIARRYRVPLVKTRALLGALDFFDHIHNTKEGHQKIARVLAQEILKTLESHSTQPNYSKQNEPSGTL